MPRLLHFRQNSYSNKSSSHPDIQSTRSSEEKSVQISRAPDKQFSIHFDSSMAAHVIAHPDKLAPCYFRFETIKNPLFLAVVVCVIHRFIIGALAFLSLRPRNDPIITRIVSRRTTLYVLYAFSKIHMAVILTRFYMFLGFLADYAHSTSAAKTLSFLPCRLLDFGSNPFSASNIRFEILMYLVRRFSRTIHDQIPSCIAGETKMRKKFPLVLLALRLTDEHEIERRAKPDKLSFSIDSRIEKGVSGPYKLSSLRPKDLVYGLTHRSDQIPDDAVIFALSYTHKDRDPSSKSLSVQAAAAVCKALQNINVQCADVYLWSDITLARNFARDLWTDDGLMPYIAYPTIKIGTEETYWTSVESDLAHARNAQSSRDDMVSFTRHFVALRRDRCLEEEAPDVNVLLCRMRAVALGMRPSRGKSGLQMVVNSTRIVGPPLQPFTVSKELKGAWHGVSEFVSEGDHIEGDPYRYLCSVIVKCTCMFVLEKDKSCYAVQIYKDGYGDLLVIALSMVRQREGWYRVIKKVRLTPPACDQRQLLELHSSQTSEISLSRMKEILECANIYANIENVSTKRVDLRKISMR